MQKAKKYDWKDSNLALFGSDTEKKVKKESAESEPAWNGAGQEVGLQIWRINKFKVESWPKEEYGEFFNGDSYIILNTYQNEGEDELNYDLHFWIGKYSTQDEYGTAAYKTVELDTLLDDKPVQHREVGSHESNLFKSYFPAIKLMKGGADTGFRRVLPEAYTPRLFHVKKLEKQKRKMNKRITVKEVSLKKANYSEDDVFILDLGNSIYQINGANSTHDEKYAAAQEVNNLLGSRGKAKKSIIDGAPFDDPDIAGHFKDSEKKEKTVTEWGGNKLFVISDNDGSLDMDPVESVSKDSLDPNNVYVLDSEHGVYVWIGAEASVDERKNAMAYACNYLSKTEYAWKPVSVIAQGKENDAFNAAW